MCQLRRSRHAIERIYHVLLNVNNLSLGTFDDELLPPSSSDVIWIGPSIQPIILHED